MTDVHPVPAEWADRAMFDDERYRSSYARSVSDRDGFWREEARRLDWIAPFENVDDSSFAATISASTGFEEAFSTCP